MASRIAVLHILVDQVDMDAFGRELIDIFRRYGFEDDEVQPHHRKARAAELKRAKATFLQCVEVADG